MDTRQAHQDTHQDEHPARQDGRQEGHQDTHQERQDGRQEGLGGEWLPIAEAARRLGVSADAVRRRVRRRTLKARRVKATHGGADPYLVWLEGPPPGTRQDGRQVRQDVHQDTRQVPREHQDGRQDGHQERQDGHQERQDAARTSALALAQARAVEMAAYSQQLLAPYVKQIAEQAEELGRLRGEVEQLRAALTPDPEAPRAPSPEWEARRWWQRLLWG